MKKFKYLFLFSFLFLQGCNTNNLPNTIGSDNKGLTALSQKDFNNEIELAPIIKEDLNTVNRKFYDKYDFSETFMNKLNEFTYDNILDKNDFSKIYSISNKKEKSFLDIIKNKEYFTMTNLKNNLSDRDELSFIINKDFSIKSDFYKQLSNLLNDNVLEKDEKDQLIVSANNDEKEFLENLFKYSSYRNFPVLKGDNSISDIVLSLKYDENQEVKGKTNAEIVSNIGQSDNLLDTEFDSKRCGSALIINFLLLNKGKEAFFDLSKKLDLNYNSLTFKNVHLTQEKIMDKLQSNKGLTLMSSNTNLLGGSLTEGFNLAGIKWENKLAEKINNSYESEIKEYLSKPNRGLAVSGFVDTLSNKTRFDMPSNHVVLLTHENGKYFLTDSSGSNALGKNHFELDNQELQNIYKSSGYIVKIST